MQGSEVIIKRLLPPVIRHRSIWSNYTVYSYIFYYECVIGSTSRVKGQEHQELISSLNKKSLIAPGTMEDVINDDSINKRTTSAEEDQVLHGACGNIVMSYLCWIHSREVCLPHRLDMKLSETLRDSENFGNAASSNHSDSDGKYLCYHLFISLFLFLGRRRPSNR